MAKMGRPLAVIDLDVAEKLGQIQCTHKECAAFMGIPEGTLANREDFTTAYKKGLEVGKISLRRLQFKQAEKSPAMAIWLGKQYLGQTEKFEATNEELINQDIVFSSVPRRGAGTHRFSKYINR